MSGTAIKKGPKPKAKAKVKSPGSASGLSFGLPLPKLTRVSRALPFVAAVTLIAFVGIHPRNVDDSSLSGNRFLAEGVGYKAAVDKMANLNLFKVRTLRSDGGLPARSTVAFDEKAIKQAEANQNLCKKLERGILARISISIGSFFNGSHNDATECRKLLSEYASATFLKQDMVRASRETWLVRGNSITGIRPQAHTLRESGFDPNSADFKITYRYRNNVGSKQWSLVDPVTLEARSMQHSGSKRRCENELIPGEFKSYCFRSGMIIEYPKGQSGWQVFKNGKAHNRPASSALPSLLPLIEGETVAFAKSGQSPKKTLQLLRRRQSLSEISGGVRVRDSAFAGLASQVDFRLTRDLRSSIEPDLQATLQEELDRVLGDAPKRAGASLRGAILLMDGMTGEIPAGATFPSKPEHLLQKDRQEPSRTIWLEQNQSFEALPVGSTAKIPFAAAIASARPSLLNMKLPNSTDIQYNPNQYLRNGSFARSRVSKGGALLAGTGLSNLGFRDAIARSDNLYAVQLIRDAWHATRDNPQDSNWLHNVHVLTCGVPELSEQNYKCPMYLWADNRSRDRGPRHKGATFVFDKAKVEARPHNQLFYGPLGNGSYNWSLVQLTQSYARFMSGKLVSATLSEIGNKGASLASQLRGDGYARTYPEVMRGMRNVIADRSLGTAKSIADLEAKLGKNIYLYAKTGTPTVGYRRGVDGKVIVLAAIRTKNNRPPVLLTDQAQICSMRFLAINLQFDTSQLKVVRALLTSNRKVSEWMTAEC